MSEALQRGAHENPKHSNPCSLSRWYELPMREPHTEHSTQHLLSCPHGKNTNMTWILVVFLFFSKWNCTKSHLFVVVQHVKTPPHNEHKLKAVSSNGPFYSFYNFLPKLHRYNYFDTVMKRKWDLGTVGLSNNTISCQTSQHWQSQRALSIPIGNIWFYCRNIIYFHQVAIIRKDMIAE